MGIVSKFKGFFKFMSNRTMGTLTNREFAIQVILLLIFWEVFTVLFCLCSGNFFWPVTKKYIFYACHAIAIPYFASFFVYRFLERKFDIYATAEKDEYSFEGQIVGSLFGFFGVLLFCIIWAWPYGNPIQGFGFGFAIFYPSLVLFFKRGVFSEKTKISDEPEIRGYDPKDYVVLGICSGFALIFLGFGTFNAICLRQSTYPLWLSLLTIGLGLVYVILVLSPEVWNKYLPFEVQENKGYLMYLILTSAIGFLLALIMAYAYPKI